MSEDISKLKYWIILQHLISIHFGLPAVQRALYEISTDKYKIMYFKNPFMNNTTINHLCCHQTDGFPLSCDEALKQHVLNLSL